MASDWDRYEDTIEQLYLDRNNSLDDVRNIMKERFKFSASKTEYERRLRKSRIQKNWKAPHIKFLKVRLEQRRQDNKESNVFVHGKLQPMDEIEKRIARCNIPVPERYELERCQTPEGLTVTTPPSERYELERYRTPEGFTAIAPTSDGYILCARSRDLPWIYFLGQLSITRNLNISIDMPPQMHKTLITAVCRGRSLTIWEQMEENFRYLSASLPVKRNDDIYSVLNNIIGTDYASATIHTLKITVYLLSNKLLCYTDSMLVYDELLRWFQMGDNHLVLQSILSYRLPTIEAFAEGLYASALEAQDRQIVSIFLKSGMNPNIRIGDREYSHRWEFNCTPLTFATRRRNLGLIELLLEFGADVNMKSGILEGTPLENAALNGSMEIAELLLSRGANVNRLKDDYDDYDYIAHYCDDYYVDDYDRYDDDDGDYTKYHAGYDNSLCGTKYGSSPLQLAALGGYTELASILLNRGADINSPLRGHGCPLECAIRARAASLIEMLLERGADIDYGANSCFNTPLQSAAMVDDAEMVHRLLGMGADANAPAPNRRHTKCRTALQWAAENGNFQLCQVLMKAGAEPNAAPAEDEGITTLAAAVRSNNHQVVEHLLKHGAEVNDTRAGQTALEVAAEQNDTAMTQLLLLEGADPALGEPLYWSLKMQNYELASLLLAADADINAPTRGGQRLQRLLSDAVENQDLKLVQHLLDLGVDPSPDSEKSSDPLVEAVKLGNLEITEILLRAGARCNKYCPRWDLTALQMAARKANIDVVRRLLIAGADLNYPAARSVGRTALQAAVESQSLELIQFLIDKGAALNSPAAEVCGATALQAAILSRDEALVRLLLDAGANANDAPSPSMGFTSIQTAANNGDNGLVCLLLQHGADVNAPAADRQGRTALQAAAEQGYYETVQLLLAKGAHINAPGSRERGIAALQAAAGGGYLHIADTLLNAGADVNAQVFFYHKDWPRTALEAAANGGRIDMLKLLLNAGADITSDFGQSQLNEALRFATKNGHDAAAKFLKCHSNLLRSLPKSLNDRKSLTGMPCQGVLDVV